MSGFGGLLAFQVKGGQEEALALTTRLKLIRRATSLGGTETTIDHRASVEPPGFGTPPNLLRLSVGIEHVDDLIADLEQALRG
jgi:cystathionine gamma-synthase